MPGVSIYGIRTGSTALAAGSTKSLWLANPATDGFVPTRVGISMDASASSQGVGFELYRTTTLGTPAGTTATIVKYGDPNSAAATTTGLTVLTAEPTAVEVLEEWFIQPFGGLLVIDNPLGSEPGAVGGGQRIGLRYITPASVTPNCRSYILFKEG